MKTLAAALGLLWGLGNLCVAVLFITGGLAEKAANKGGAQQALLVLGGLLVGVFALILIWQCVTLARARLN